MIYMFYTVKRGPCFHPAPKILSVPFVFFVA